MRQKTVLILDDDLGFSMWLGNALNNAGFRAFPAGRSEEALAIVSAASVPHVDLVIANFQIEGCQALLDTLARQCEGLKVICIGDAGSRHVDATLQRPRGKTLPKPDRYVKAVRKVLSC